MRKDKLEKFLGKRVTITLFDKTVITGEFHKGGEERFKNIPNLYYKPKYYFCINPQSCLFRSSHVIKIKEREASD